MTYSPQQAIITVIGTIKQNKEDYKARHYSCHTLLPTRFGVIIRLLCKRGTFTL